MSEKIIVSLTSYGERLNNLPVVLNTIFAQTLLPDIVVLNLAYEEVLPEKIEAYLNSHDVEINRVTDTKVYKKLIPTLKKYPNDCVICIDDDWLYPNKMIEDFMEVHKKFPDNPISGNRYVLYGMQFHCGCASLTKKDFFGEYFDLLDEDVLANCKSDDVFYTYCAIKTKHPYVRTSDLYFWNMQPYNPIASYSENNPQCIVKTLSYLNCRFGEIDKTIKLYLSIANNEEIVGIIDDIEGYYMQQIKISQMNFVELQKSKTFRLGYFLLTPFRFVRNILHRN